MPLCRRLLVLAAAAALTAGPAFAQVVPSDAPVATADAAATPPSGGVIPAEQVPPPRSGVDQPLPAPEVQPCHGVLSGSVGTRGYRDATAVVQCSDGKGHGIGIAVNTGRGPDIGWGGDGGPPRRR